MGAEITVTNGRFSKNREFACCFGVMQGLIGKSKMGYLNGVPSKSKRDIRIGAVSYLNTKPLIHTLKEQFKESISLSLDLPSRLADELQLGRLDVALIPSIEWMRSPNLHLISDACIACSGEVWSVKLLFRTHPSEVRSLALDEGSRTSAALAQVLLYNRFGVRPETVPLPMDQHFSDADSDAVLVIGDRAMKLATPQHALLRGFCEVWDLGKEWWIDTKLPFVFAAWVGHAEYQSSPLALGFEKTRDEGLANAWRLAEIYAPSYHLTVEQCHRYFTCFLDFRMNDQKWRGLRTFYEMARRLDFVAIDHPSFTLTAEIA